jgi:hypothetical protein
LFVLVLFFLTLEGGGEYGEFDELFFLFERRFEKVFEKSF